jgi:glycosyltransferase involved in cell wall biosynthesis
MRAEYFVKVLAEDESMNASDFKVSVVIPTFNRAVFLAEAIQSILAQTLPVYEIIVLDDGSTDNTSEVIRAYGEKIRYFKQKNQGPSVARNYAMREAGGNWIAFLDSDDLWVPEKNQLQAEFICQHPYLEFVFGDQAVFSERHSAMEPEILNLVLHQNLQKNAADLKDLFRQLLFCNPIPTSSVFLRSDCLPRVGFFDETLPIASEDYEYWLRLAFVLRAGFVDHILVKRRMHDSNAMNARIPVWQGILKLLKHLRQKNDLPAEIHQILRHRIASIQYDLASDLIKRGRFKDASMHLGDLQSNDLNSSPILRLKVLLKRIAAKCLG